MSGSRDSLDNPEVLGRLPDYLLIRLITVFDPAFCRVFFLVLSLWFRCFRLMKSGYCAVCCNDADHSKGASIKAMLLGQKRLDAADKT
ncbi:hypothetical protein ALP23_101763 [Pseudomonas syringae pv. apii]|uniref:Uncharacterized protein n=1 Tax=Pseudomonas syringae pv. apii TaxID=81036 RepID=A0A3M5WMI6_9PSED|nr:hypothetical protein ALP23_101763 [Pseudomonas syringae pv. apii]